jgi:hypothetical protein
MVWYLWSAYILGLFTDFVLSIVESKIEKAIITIISTMVYLLIASSFVSAIK